MTKAQESKQLRAADEEKLRKSRLPYLYKFFMRGDVYDMLYKKFSDKADQAIFLNKLLLKELSKKE